MMPIDRSGTVDLSRRHFVAGALVAAASLNVACGGGKSEPVPVETAGPAGSPPVWALIPDQVWTVGVPVTLDLSQYCTDPNGDQISFTLDQPLPPGLSLSGNVISGTPTAAFDVRTFVATADDGKAV